MVFLDERNTIFPKSSTSRGVGTSNCLEKSEVYYSLTMSKIHNSMHRRLVFTPKITAGMHYFQLDITLHGTTK